MRIGRIAAVVGIVLAGTAIAQQAPAHATPLASVGCATGQTPTVISTLYTTLYGRATNALPAPAASAAVPPAISITGTENPPIVVPMVTSTGPITIPAPLEYGLFNYIAGIKPVVLPGAVNEISDFFTFFASASKLTDSNVGSVNSSIRTGTFAINLGHGDFSNAQSFQLGSPILTASVSQQILAPVTTTTFQGPGRLSISVAGVPPTNTANSTSTTATTFTAGSTFTSTSTATITSVSPFTYGGTCYQLGSVGQQFSVASAGQFDSAGIPSGYFTGALTSH